MATRTTQSQIINDMRLLMGLNTDGSRNGNGLLGDVKNLKSEIESINRNLISIDHKLARGIEEREEMAANIKEIKRSIASSMDEINKNLADKISVNTISKAHKTIIAIAASLGALGAIFTIISNLLSKLG